MCIVNNLSQLLNFVLPAKSFYSSEILYEKSSESPQTKKQMEVEPSSWLPPAAECKCLTAEPPGPFESLC